MLYDTRYYWKLNEKTVPLEEKKEKPYWLKNDLDHLHFEDELIIRSTKRGCTTALWMRLKS